MQHLSHHNSIRSSHSLSLYEVQKSTAPTVPRTSPTQQATPTACQISTTTAPTRAPDSRAQAAPHSWRLRPPFSALQLSTKCPAEPPNPRRPPASPNQVQARQSRNTARASFPLPSLRRRLQIRPRTTPWAPALNRHVRPPAAPTRATSMAVAANTTTNKPPGGRRGRGTHSGPAHVHRSTKSRQLRPILSGLHDTPELLAPSAPAPPGAA